MIAVCKPLREHPENGEQSCKGDGNIGTSCTYTCNDGFRLEGEPESICKAAGYGADWTAPVPTCIRKCLSLTITRSENIGSDSERMLREVVCRDLTSACVT